MISTSINQIVFHIFFTIGIGSSSVKILQISELVCDNGDCDLNQNKYVHNVINFVKKKELDVILWFSKLKTNNTMLQEMANSSLPKKVFLPVYDTDRSKSGCSNFSKVTKNCYYLHHLNQHNICFVVLNTKLWLNPNKIDSGNMQIDWLKKTLESVKQKQGKVIIVGFDSPGSLETASGAMKYNHNYNKIIVELLQRYSSTISGCIFASERIDSFRIVMDDKGQPLIPLFLAPTITKNAISTTSSARLYVYNSQQSIMDNYIQFRCKVTNNVYDWREEYNFNIVYGTTSVNAKDLYRLTESFADNLTDHFKHYNRYQLHNVSFDRHCAKAYNRWHCDTCCASCFILNLIAPNVTDCLSQCNVRGLVSGVMTAIDGGTGGRGSMATNNNNVFFILGVIIGFVVILVGIVLAVNKVYCIKFNRHRNVFMAPLKLDISDDIASNHFDGQLSSSTDNVVIACQTKTGNGGVAIADHRRSNHESEQTYDYIRM